MSPKHQKAFNAALVAVLRSKKKGLKLNEKTRKYDVVIPLSEVTKNFRKFIDVVEKDLKIGQYKEKPKTRKQVLDQIKNLK